ncbi:MAG TPA: P-loop NTPase [Chloroflexia bacterium]|nr:P-loop NTPase [Chloroflexia bacterium]
MKHPNPEGIRPPPRPVSGVKHVLAVASGKGGVGKTTVTVNLALALSQAGARVGIFDADIYGPNVPVMLGLSRTKPSEGLLTVGRVENKPYIEPLERYGLRVMSVGLLVAENETVSPDPNFAGLIVTRTMQDVLWGDLDYLLLDLPPGTGEPQGSILQRIRVDGAVVVTTPQDLSLLDAGRSLGFFHKAKVPILGVVENMSYMVCPECGKAVEVFHRSERQWPPEYGEVELLGRIPMNIDISKGIDSGHPLLQTSHDTAETRIFLDIAGRLQEKLT